MAQTDVVEEKPKSARSTVMRQLLRIGGLVTIAVAVLVYTWPLLAAVEFIQPFTVTTSSNNITMSWITGSEYNVAGFEILCKRADEPESAYHVIQSAPAMGGLNQSASYAYTFNQGFEPNVPYCFRLREITTDVEPGDYFERCGYGLDITPTPGAAPTFTPVVVITATATITGAQTIVDENGNIVTATPDPNLQPGPTSPLPTPVFNSPLPAPEMTLTAQAGGISPDVAATAQALGVSPEVVLTAQAAGVNPQTVATAQAIGVSPEAVLTAQAIGISPQIVATAQIVGISPEMLSAGRAAGLNPALLLTAQPFGLNAALVATAQAAGPIPDVALTAQAVGINPDLLSAAQGAGLNPALVLTARAYNMGPEMLLTAQAASVNGVGNATPTPTFPPTPTETWTVQPVEVTPTPSETPSFTPSATQTPVTPSVGGGPGDGAQAPNQPDAPGPAYVVWTATPTAPQIALNSAFTPLPTVTATPVFNVAQVITSSTENVLFMALCFIFFGASGLGIAGLITSALYLRSRNRNDLFGD